MNFCCSNPLRASSLQIKDCTAHNHSNPTSPFLVSICGVWDLKIVVVPSHVKEYKTFLDHTYFDLFVVSLAYSHSILQLYWLASTSNLFSPTYSQHYSASTTMKTLTWHPNSGNLSITNLAISSVRQRSLLSSCRGIFPFFSKGAWVAR